MGLQGGDGLWRPRKKRCRHRKAIFVGGTWSSVEWCPSCGAICFETNKHGRRIWRKPTNP